MLSPFSLTTTPLLSLGKIFFLIDEIAMAGDRKRLRNLSSRNSYGSTFLGLSDPSASTSGTTSDFFDDINLNV
ncbi:hypothetical protein Bca101_054741 [Brassica carinata]